ncbi:MAG: peptidylprolyl isomerase [Myxococcales bacterium]
MATDASDLAERRRAVRALARLAGPSSVERLRRGLADEDPEAAAWSAYGLGVTCVAPDEARTRAIVARAVSLTAGLAAGHAAAWFRAVAKCADGPLGERWLASRAKEGGPVGAEAAYALGELAARRRRLSSEARAALVEAMTEHAMDAALYPFVRLDEPIEDDRVLAGAERALTRATEDRIFAVRALALTGDRAAEALAQIVEQEGYTVPERVQAARALGGLGPGGKRKVVEILARLFPVRADPQTRTSTVETNFALASTLLGSLGSEAPKGTAGLLTMMASLPIPNGATAAAVRRFGELRCTAATALVRGAYESGVIQHCAEAGTEPWERARLSALLRRKLTGEHRTAWLALVHSGHVRVAMAAIDGIGGHPELGGTARQVLAVALGSKVPGVVATASKVLHGHPERAFAGAQGERGELDPAVAKALRTALAEAVPEDRIDVRLSVLEAAVALELPEAREAARVACRDSNVTVRTRAQRLLATVGEPSVVCEGAESVEPVEGSLTASVRVRFQFETAVRSIRLDPSPAPVSSFRVVALARAGFYSGMVVHRVVPGFVVQFGDAGGDGFGGSGKLLRCETGPVTFGALDVGMALSGRDTGSSQLFVTLVRAPHLDGEFSRVGHAEGTVESWSRIAEGDRIEQVVVED